MDSSSVIARLINEAYGFFRTGQNWGSLRIDGVNGQLISGLRQVFSVESECGNARDDREELVLDKRIIFIYNDYKLGIIIKWKKNKSLKHFAKQV